jgi:predicted nucleotidyltransferase
VSGAPVGDDGHALDERQLRTLAERLASVRGVVGVTLGGSRARGDHTPESDVDLGVYYRPPLDVDGLRRLARDVGGPAAEVTEPGEWGPWVDGGAWLRVDGTAVDWIYRDVDRVRSSCDDARSGRLDFFFQVGHPLGVPSFGYAGELALGVLLADPAEELVALRRQVATYPPALADALIARLWEARFCVDIARKAVPRADSAYVAGCLFRAVELCAHAVHGHARRWLVNEKGAVAAAGRLPAAPALFASRSHAVLADLGATPDRLHAAVTAAAALVADVEAACSAPVER